MAVHNGKPIYVRDVQSNPRYIETVEGVHTELAAPLQVEGKVIGVLSVKSDKRDAFKPQSIQLLSTLATQAATAIERARLFKETRQRTEELGVIHRTGQVLTSTLNLQEVLARIMKETIRLLQAEGGSVLLYDSDAEQLAFAASAGASSDDLANMRIPADAGIAGWVFQNAQPLLVHDAQRDPRFYDRIDVLTGLTTRSLLAAPLICKGKTSGVLEVVSEEVGAFDKRDLRLLSTLAGPAAIAIENARLHEEVSRLLSEARVLQEITVAAASTLDFDQVLTRTIRAIRCTLHLDYLVFALPDASGEGLTIHPSLVGFVSPSEEYLHIPLKESVCGRVYTTGEPELVEDLSESSHCFKETPGLRSLLAVPVRLKDRTIAVLGAGSIRTEALTERELHLFQAIAAQLSIAIENARLYEAERELRKLVEMSRTQLVTNERLVATGRLAASLAHEINNPLQAIHNSLQILLAFPLEPEEQQEHIQIAAEEVERLISLATRMLDFARHPRRNVKPTQVNDLVERTLTLCNKYLQHHHISIRQDLNPDLPPVLANPDELAQVFLNLTLNAVDAMPYGGSLYVSSRIADDGRVTVSFTDTGHGVPEEHAEQIFEPFFTTKENGSGLGLSVSRDVVKRHRGEITAQSVTGKGTTFTVWLPPLGETGERG